MEVKQYDIVLVNLEPTIGVEMQKTRPCLLISPGEMNSSLRTVQIAPMTTTLRRYPWRVPITFQRTKGMIALDQIRTIDQRRVLKRLGKARPQVVSTIKLVIHEMLVR
jgi:mRNA interferase MazF